MCKSFLDNISKYCYQLNICFQIECGKPLDYNGGLTIEGLKKDGYKAVFIGIGMSFLMSPYIYTIEKSNCITNIVKIFFYIYQLSYMQIHCSNNYWKMYAKILAFNKVVAPKYKYKYKS